MKQKQTGGNMNARKGPLHRKKKSVSGADVLPAGVTPNSEKAADLTVKAVPAEPAVRPRRIIRPDYPEEEMTLEMLDRYGTPPDEKEQPAKKTKPAGCARINLESGMPTVDEALFRMNTELHTAKQRGCRAAKLIHGYGSSGTGGRIRIGVRKELEAMKKRRQIRDFIPGEEFGPFGYGGHPVPGSVPDMTKDPDYGNGNQGITIVIL
ncbi:MAG: hypothetical protein MJ142_06070 [Clostridia bacterium]|nr:hypothetical protein [Clostridia bacterium]